MARCHEYGCSRELCLCVSVLIKSHSTTGLKNNKQWFAKTNNCYVTVQSEFSELQPLCYLYVVIMSSQEVTRSSTFSLKSSDESTSQSLDRLGLKQRQLLTASQARPSKSSSMKRQPRSTSCILNVIRGLISRTDT